MRAFENAISVLQIDAAAEHCKGLALILGMQFLDPAGQHHVVSAQSHQRAGLLERGGGRGAGILHVDDGDAADAEFAQGNLAGDAGLARNHASADVSDPSGLQIAAFQVAIAKGAQHRLAKQRFDAAVAVLAERGHGHASNVGVLPHL